MPGTEINVGALGCVIASLTRALEYAHRLDEQAMANPVYTDRGRALVDSFRRELERVGRNTALLLKDVPQLPPLRGEPADPAKPDATASFAGRGSNFRTVGSFRSGGDAA